MGDSIIKRMVFREASDSLLDDKLVGDSQPLDMNVPFSGLTKVRTVSKKTKGGFVANEGCPVGCRTFMAHNIQPNVGTEL